MDTQHTYDNNSLIVEPILSDLCWKEYDLDDRLFTYTNLKGTIELLKSGAVRAHRNDYSEAVTAALKELHVPETEWTVIRSLVSKYFKRVKGAKVYHPLDDKHWIISVDENSREIFLYQPATMTRSESLYTSKRFELGSVLTERRPCRDKRQVELHRSKGIEITYRVLSGKYPEAE